MSIILKETGEDIEFMLFDPETKLNYSVSWLMNAGAFAQAQAGWDKGSKNEWLIDREQYAWWADIVSMEQEAINLMYDNQDSLTKGVLAHLKLARSKDIKKLTEARLGIVKEAVANKAKMNNTNTNTNTNNQTTN